MAHNLTQRPGGMYEMAFVGETPWHGHGQRVTKGASIDQWAREAGLDWSGIMAPVLYRDESGNLRDMDEKRVIYRSDTRAPLGVVGADYKIVQPAEVLDFFRHITESEGWHIHTAGTLNGGRRLWVMASNHTEGEAARGDKVRGNLLLATSLDGSLKTHAAMVAIRVVCANTLRVALDEIGRKGGKANGRTVSKSPDSIAISHRSEFNAAKVHEHLGTVRGSFDRFMSQARELAESPIGQEQARDILRQLFGQPRVIKPEHQEPVTVARGSIDGSEFAQLLQRPAALAGSITADVTKVIEHRTVPKVLELFNGAARGADHAGSAGTKWGLFNAVTEYLDHHAGRSSETRLGSSWFGPGQDVKSEALQLLLAR